MHASATAASRSTVRVQRDFAAPPDKIFDAWLDPALVARWMAPGTLAARAQIDSWQGGRYRITHIENGRSVGGFDAMITELDRPKRLVFDWGMIGPEGEAGQRFDSRLTIIFDELPTGTRLSLIHEELDAFAAALPDIADLIEVGWNDVFDKLAELVE